MKSLRKIALPVLSAALLLGMLLVMVSGAAAGTEKPYPGAPSRVETRTFYGPTRVTSSTTVYTSITTTVNGALIARVADFNSADVFIVGSLATSSNITGTVQFSPDLTNWASATYDYWNGSAIGTQTYVRSLSSTGATYVQVPIAGEYMRVQLATRGTVTPTVRITLRNN
jgi:hypothetical protein